MEKKWQMQGLFVEVKTVAFTFFLLPFYPCTFYPHTYTHSLNHTCTFTYVHTHKGVALANRTRTNTSVSWTNIAPWTVVGVMTETPNITAIVREIISIPGWQPGSQQARASLFCCRPVFFLKTPPDYFIHTASASISFFPF